MGKYESTTIFDGRGNKIRMTNPDDNGISKIELFNNYSLVEFYANTDKQSDIIQHFVNFSPDCKDLALKRLSYELLTMRSQFDSLIESYHLLKSENEHLKNLINTK